MFELRKWCCPGVALAAIAATGLLGAARDAAATTFFATDGGVVEAAGCLEASCTNQTFDDTIGGFASVSGSITIDSLLLDFTLTLTQPVGLTSSGDNGVTAIEFTDVVYSVTDLPLMQIGPDKFMIDGTLPGGPTASVAGDYSQNGGSPDPFAESNARVTGICDVMGDTVLCGLTFGTSGFDLAVGPPVPAPGTNQRFFRHMMNVTAVVPEPSTGLLLSLGLLGLALRRR